MGIVDRVFFWCWLVLFMVEELVLLLVIFKARYFKWLMVMILRVYDVVVEVYVNQWCELGEKYILYLLVVVGIVVNLGFDDVVVVVVLLYDVVEDFELIVVEVYVVFGFDVVVIVDGVIKFEWLQFDSKEVQQVVMMRKMLVVMVKDLRVLIIKLVDWFYNMRIIVVWLLDKQVWIVVEIFDIYVLLVYCLGMQELKQQLEDLLFSALYFKCYVEIDYMVVMCMFERDLYLVCSVVEVE